MAPIGSALRAVSSEASRIVIPDSAVYNFDAGTFTTGDPTWTDDVSGVDMSITGDPQRVTMSNGEPGVEADGTDGYGLAPLDDTGQFNGTSFEFSIETTETGDMEVFGVRSSGSTQRLALRLNRDESFQSWDGGFVVYIRDTDGRTGDRWDIAPATNPGLNDGSVHKVSIVFQDTSTNDADIYIDGSSVSVNSGNSQSVSGLNTWNEDMAFYGYNNQGTVERFSNVALGVWRWHDTTISKQTI